MNDERVHVNINKSVFEHSCSGREEGSRKRAVLSEVALAAPSPVRKMLTSSTDSKSVHSSISDLGIHIKLSTIQGHIRAFNTTSWEQYVVELCHLEDFMEKNQQLDQDGLFFVESDVDTYCGTEVRVF